MEKEKIILYCDRAIMTCLCFLIFFLPFAKAGVEIFTWLAIFFWISKRALGYRAGSLWGLFPKTELNKALGLFIAVNALSTIFSVNFGLSARGFFGKELKFIAIYFMLVEVINSRERLRILLFTIIASVVLIITDAGVQYFRGADFLKGYERERISASFSTGNDFAGWLIIIIPLFLSLLAVGKGNIGKGLKALLLILIISLIVCLLATFARGGWLGFVISIFLMAYYAIKNFSLKTKILCLSTGICLLAIFLILPQPIKVKISAIGRINFKSCETVNARIKSTLKIEKGSTPVRINLWKEALRIIRDYNFSGCGLNTYSIVARKYKSFEQGGIYPHNSYLQMTAETGLLGLFAFLWVLFGFFKMGLRHLNEKKNSIALGLLAGISAFLVHAFFDTHLYALQLVVLFWFMLGLTVAVINIDRRKPI